MPWGSLRLFFGVHCKSIVGKGLWVIFCFAWVICVILISSLPSLCLVCVARYNVVLW